MALDINARFNDAPAARGSVGACLWLGLAGTAARAHAAGMLAVRSRAHSGATAEPGKLT